MKLLRRMPQSPRLHLAAAVAVALFCLEAQAAQRLAMVVGNDAYQQATKLRNARNDAQAVGKELEAAGFAVTRVFDATRTTFNDQLDGFLRKIQKGDEVVFYFSGHGSQPPQKGPYLLPVDVKPTERSITSDGQSLELLVADLNQRSRFTLVIIDACRDDPTRATSSGRSIAPGSTLSNFAPPNGSVVLMAASKGQEALDRLGPSDNTPNGLFTRELVKWIRKPGIPVREMLHQVKFSVEKLAATVNHQQRPSITDESSDDFYFYPPRPGQAPAPAPTAPPTVRAPDPVYTPQPAVAPTPAPAPAPYVPPPVATSRPAPQQASATVSEAQREYDAWEAAQKANTRAAIEGFVRSFPQGRYVGMAQQKLAGMPAAAPAPAPVAAPKPAAYNPQVEYELWDKADTSKRRADYEAYLAAYPNGRYVDLARAALKTAK